MNELQSKRIQCPYCGEIITVLLDCSVPEQEYIEDCEVCCRPIYFQVFVDQYDEVQVYIKNENE